MENQNFSEENFRCRYRSLLKDEFLINHEGKMAPHDIHSLHQSIIIHGFFKLILKIEK